MGAHEVRGARPRLSPGPAADILARRVAGESVANLVRLLGDLGHSSTVPVLRRWIARKAHAEGVPLPGSDDRADRPSARPATGQKVSVVTEHGDLVRRLAREGKSTATIAQAVAIASGRTCTKNMVLAWCFRNSVKLDGTLSKGQAARVATRNRPRMPGSGKPTPPVRPAAVVVETVRIDARGVNTILTRRADGCAWIDWDGDGPARHDSPVCNAPVVPGSSWCAAHRRVVFVAQSGPLSRAQSRAKSGARGAA